MQRDGFVINDNDSNTSGKEGLKQRKFEIDLTSFYEGLDVCVCVCVCVCWDVSKIILSLRLLAWKNEQMVTPWV